MTQKAKQKISGSVSFQMATDFQISSIKSGIREWMNPEWVCSLPFSFPFRSSTSPFFLFIVRSLIFSCFISFLVRVSVVSSCFFLLLLIFQSFSFLLSFSPFLFVFLSLLSFPLYSSRFIFCQFDFIPYLLLSFLHLPFICGFLLFLPLPFPSFRLSLSYYYLIVSLSFSFSSLCLFLVFFSPFIPSLRLPLFLFSLFHIPFP